MMLWKPLYNIVGMILYYDILLKAFVLSASEGKILALIQALEFGSRVFNFEYITLSAATLYRRGFLFVVLSSLMTCKADNTNHLPPFQLGLVAVLPLECARPSITVSNCHLPCH